MGVVMMMVATGVNRKFVSGGKMGKMMRKNFDVK